MRFIFCFITILACLSAFAQTVSKPFFAAVAEYEESLNITFSYDAELLALINKESLFTSNDLSKFLDEIADRLPLTVEKIGDEYYTVSVEETKYQLTVSDSLDGSVIDQSFGIQVVINEEPVPASFKDGYWEFFYKPDQKDKIFVFSQGYQLAPISLRELFNQKSVKVTLGLTTYRLNTVVVEDYLTKGINMLPSKQQIQIDVNHLPLLPGETDGDIFASIAALPGITNPDNRAGNIFIRGSETDQTLILFDNIPVYHRGHYYGTISPYNSKIVDDVEVYRSGFHPKYGDRVGGAILINSDETENESIYGVGANTLFGMGYGKVRFNEKWKGSFGIRNSYSRKFESPKLTEISESVFAATALVGPDGKLTERVEVLFRDYNARLSHQLNKRNKVSFSALYTLSDVRYSPPIPPDQPKRSIQNEYENIGVNLGWDKEWLKGWNSTLNTTYSSYNYLFNIHVKSPGILPIYSENTIDDFNVIQETSKRGENAGFQIGLDYKWQQVSMSYQNLQRDSSYYTLDRADRTHIFSPFINYEYYGWDKWYIQLGARGTYFSGMTDLSFSPRVLINYDLTSSTTLKGSFGLYNQFLSQVKNLEFTGGGFDNELWVLANGETGFIIRGIQSMIGGLVTKKNWVFDVEAFYKRANNITVFEDRRLNPERDYFSMKQETYGIDVLIKNQVTNDASVWVGYSYHDSRIALDTTENETYKSKYVQPHVIYVGGALKKKRWKLSAGYRHASGLNAQSLDIAFAKAIFDRGPQGPPPPGPPPENPFSDIPERYPNIHFVDLSVSYKIPQNDQRKWSSTFGLSCINLLDQNNLTDRVYRSRDGFVDRDAIGFAPNLMVIFEW